MSAQLFLLAETPKEWRKLTDRQKERYYAEKNDMGAFAIVKGESNDAENSLVFAKTDDLYPGIIYIDVPETSSGSSCDKLLIYEAMGMNVSARGRRKINKVENSGQNDFLDHNGKSAVNWNGRDSRCPRYYQDSSEQMPEAPEIPDAFDN